MPAAVCDSDIMPNGILESVVNEASCVSSQCRLIIKDGSSPPLICGFIDIAKTASYCRRCRGRYGIDPVPGGYTQVHQEAEVVNLPSLLLNAEGEIMRWGVNLSIFLETRGFNDAMTRSLRSVSAMNFVSFGVKTSRVVPTLLHGVSEVAGVSSYSGVAQGEEGSSQK
eukprot:CAMPEP_0184648066 /NCGR_PEP_ID=MMETSP0308-20130426/5142_1 /TAXON_ID=38269 /ORGANISM="Gloeochaete witrockiana, Strain SAG 46.84" /LENGTH=167 /DNA_ID=CAMNT_0027079601 /DNA_START=87 /DNA_END=591 /DNA_ORIENTATION=-